MKLRFTRRAAGNLTEIAEYIHARHPTGAQKVRGDILYSLQNLVLFPHAGRMQSIAGVRKLATRKYPYLIYYTVDEPAEEIIIISIQHATQKREYGDI